MNSDSSEPEGSTLPVVNPLAPFQANLARIDSLTTLYAWAAPILAQLIATNPEVETRLARASAHTRHCLGLALTAMLIQPAGPVDFQDIAKALNSRYWAPVLDRVWGRTLGPLTPLANLPAPFLTLHQYLSLAGLLADPCRREALSRFPRISPLQVERLALASDVEFETYSPTIIAGLDLRLIRFLTSVFAKIGPDLSGPALVAAFHAKRHETDLTGFLLGHLTNHPFPDAPWPGDAVYAPIRTPAELTAVVARLRVPITAPEHSLDALHGLTAYYLATKPTPCLIRLKALPTFGLWILDHIFPEDGAEMPPTVRQTIEAAFIARGIIPASTAIRSLVPAGRW